jgi:dolichyl-phosphate-mannose-protein mannosyltransferase
LARRELWALAGLTGLAAALRFSTLHVQSYELDEAVTVGLLRHDLWGMLSQIPHSESTPPLYYVLAWPWSKLFGTCEPGLRSLSALTGTTAVPVAYLAGRELVSRRAGTIVAALAAVNPLLVWEGQEARSYALLTLTAGLSVLFFGRALRGRQTGWWALTSALAVATHYFAVFLVLPEAVWLARKRGRQATAAIACVAAAGIALLPLAVEQRGHKGAEALIKDSGSLGLRIRQIPKQFLVGFDAPAETVLTLISAAVCAGAVGLLLARGSEAERRRAGVPAALAAVSVGLPLVLALAGFDYLNARNSLAAWLPAATVVAAGLSVAGARRLGTGGAVMLAAIGMAVCVAVASDVRYQRDDWRGAATALGRPAGPRAVVFSPGELRALQLYVPRSSPPPPAGVRVRELDYLILASHRAGETRRAPSLEELPPHPAGAVTLERRREETFAVARYRLPRPLRVRPGPLPPLGGKSPAVLVQSP